MSVMGVLGSLILTGRLILADYEYMEGMAADDTWCFSYICLLSRRQLLIVAINSTNYVSLGLFGIGRS